MEIYECPKDIPEGNFIAYQIATIFGSGFITDLDVAIKVLKNDVSVIVWRKHHKRGWEKH